MVHHDQQYWIYNKPFYEESDDFSQNLEDRLWFTIRDYENSASSNGFKLNLGDYLKFGRACIKVVNINFGSETPQNANDTTLQHAETVISQLKSDVNSDKYSSNKSENGDKNTCRI